ncbi:MAG: VWA domain-containing protein [Fusobacteriota bacterium]
MEFANLKNWIYILISIIGLFILIFGVRKRNKTLQLIGMEKYVENYFFRNLVMFLGIILITISLLGPQILKEEREIEKKSLDIYVLIDVSKSMLVEDVKPNRLKRAKSSIEELLNNLNGDRVGFIPFASSAYIQMPLTDDYDMSKMFLEVIDTKMMSSGGTDLDKALKLAQNSFQKSKGTDRAIIILTDGEIHDENPLETAKEIDASFYKIAIGTKNGGLIPRLDDQGKQIGWITDENNNAVTSKLNLDILKKLKGKLYRSTVTGDEIREVVKDILKLKREDTRREKIKVYNKLYQYFLGVGLLLFLIGYFNINKRI